jgi:uracil-DNA glycosylase
VDAQVLLLLDAPGPRAVKSGFVSRNNPDETAKNFFEINLAAGLDRKRTVVWNIVPWYIGTGAKIHAATCTDIKAGIPLLLRLLSLLPRLRAVVLIGRKAERAQSVIASARPKLQLLTCPHPSPLYVNHHPSHREKVRLALAAAVDQTLQSAR